jgi:hypothetical protein
MLSAAPLRLYQKTLARYMKKKGNGTAMKEEPLPTHNGIERPNRSLRAGILSCWSTDNEQFITFTI